jgi:FkbH-like protein
VEGGLAPEDFASHQKGAEGIAEHLNLKLKSFVVLDGREEAPPPALTLDPSDARNWRLLELWADMLSARPGADRTDFYHQRDERQRFITAEAEMDAAQRDRLYAQLRLMLTVREAGPEDAERAASLVNRTNQFNMAGSRVTRRWIEERIGRRDVRILIGEAADRFGPMGTIGVLVIERTEGGLDIPVFVLSCRAFGFGMERALLEEARRLAGWGQALTGAFRSTDHNQPCHPVYPKAGFVEVEGGWRMESASAATIAVAPWLSIDRRVRPFEA